MIKTIAKITTNNYQNSNNKKKKTIKSTRYIQKSSKRTSPIKIDAQHIGNFTLSDTFFNIKAKWCHSLECASPVVFPFKRIRWVNFIYKG